MINKSKKPQVFVANELDFSKAATEKLITTARQTLSVSHDNTSTIVFPTGNTVNEVKKYIIANKNKHVFANNVGELTNIWHNLTLMQMDETLHTNQYAQELSIFANQLGIPDENRILINGKNMDQEKEIETLQYNFDTHPPQIVVLGLGAHDCHIAFNQRGTTINDHARIVKFTQQTRQQQNNGDENGEISHGITVGPKELLGTDQTHILMLVNGKHKENALAEILNGPITNQAPGSLCRIKEEQFTIIADKAAAAGLEKNHDNYDLKEYPAPHDLAR